jgi:protease II
MNNKESGYVYIQTGSTSGRLHTSKNPSFHEDWMKIGKSSRLVDVRSKELANTAVPLPLEKRTKVPDPFAPRKYSSC